LADSVEPVVLVFALLLIGVEMAGMILWLARVILNVVYKQISTAEVEDLIKKVDINRLYEA
jgi:hypothetical protein